MPTLPIPFSLPLTARTWAKAIGSSAKDQQLINAFYETASDNEQGSKILYVTKRAGSTTGTSIGSGVIALVNYASLGPYFSTTTGFFASDGSSLGVLDGQVSYYNNYVLADIQVDTKYILAWATTNKTGWFLYSDAATQNYPTFTGDTHTNTVIDNLASTDGIYVGQLLSGTGIQAGTRVATITSSSAITVTLATTATNAGVTITKEAIAKIIDADFPSSVSSVASLKGRFFWADDSNSRIYQSNLNDPSAYTTDGYITPDYSGDPLQFIFKVDQYIVASGFYNTLEYFQFGQSSSGSVLSFASVVNGINIPFNAPIILNGEYFCIATNANPTLGIGQYGLYKITGTDFQRISDDILSSVITDNHGSALGIANIGNKSILLIIATNDSIAYDPSTNQFSILDPTSTITSSAGDVFTRSGSSSYLNWATGNTWQDSSVAFTMTAQTQPYALNKGKGFVINSVELLADTESSGLATLSISGDDYVTFRSPGSFNLTRTTKRVHRCGYYRNHAIFKIEDSGNNPARFQGLYVDWEPCDG